MLVFLSFLSGFVFGFALISMGVAVLGIALPKFLGFKGRVDALKFFGLMFMSLFAMATLENTTGVNANDEQGLFAFFGLLGMATALFYAFRRHKESRADKSSSCEPSRLRRAWDAFKKELTEELAKPKVLREESYVFRSELLLEYKDAEGNVSRRKISNIRFDGMYIKAYCHKRNEHRTFRIDRMISLADVVTGEIIIDPELYVHKYY